MSPSVHRIEELRDPRALTDLEQALLARLLDHPFQGASELKEQIDSLRVSAECRDCPTVEFILSAAATRSPVTERVPAEIFASDHDEALVHLLVHVVDGYVAELEVIRYDDQEVEDLSRLHDFRSTPEAAGSTPS